METATNQHILFFDGVCNLCNGLVQFVIKRDPNARIKFASLQSETGQAKLKELGLDTEEFTSFIFFDGKKNHMKSSASLNVFKKLNWLWPLLYGFIIVPRFLRDPIYSFVANRRYKWFGKQDYCWLPTPDLKARFL